MSEQTQPAGAARRWRRRALALSLPLVLLGALELALRAFDFQYWPVDAPIVVWDGDNDAELVANNGLHAFDAEQLWRPRPLAEIPWNAGERVSASGFRGRDPEPGAAPRVLSLGDSSTFGWGLPYADCWSARLESALRETRTQLQLVDGGVIGSTLVQGLARHAALRASWKPDLVIEAFGAVNEHFPAPGGEPDRERASGWRARTSEAAKLRRWLRTQPRISHLASRIADELAGGRAALKARELARLSEPKQDFAHYLEHPDYVRRVSPAEFRAGLDELRARCAADGGALLVLRMPRRAKEERERPQLAEYDRVIEEWVAASGTPWVDGRALFERELAAGASEDELFLDGFHPSARGHALLAAALRPAAEALLAR